MSVWYPTHSSSVWETQRALSMKHEAWTFQYYMLLNWFFSKINGKKVIIFGIGPYQYSNTGKGQSPIWWLLYSQSYLGWNFRKLFRSSKLKARTSLFTETWQKRRLSFELWAFENDTPSGIGCTWRNIKSFSYQYPWKNKCEEVSLFQVHAKYPPSSTSREESRSRLERKARILLGEPYKRHDLWRL